MAGLIAILVIALYFVLLIAFPIVGYKVVATRTERRGKRWLGAALGFALIFLPVFWDTVPTLWLHRHYCETEGGFTVYKTLAQWKLENPGIAELQVPIKAPNYNVSIAGVEEAYQMNQRFRWETRKRARPLGISMRDERLVDSEKEEILAKAIEFSIVLSNPFASGIHSFRDVKIWLSRTYCKDGKHDSAIWALAQIKAAIEQMGEAR